MGEAISRGGRWHIWGWVSSILFLVSVFLPFPSITNEILENPSKELVDVLADAQMTLYIRNGLSWFAAAALLIFVCGLYRHLERGAGSGGTVSVVALAGGVVTAAGLLIGFGFLAQLAGAAGSGHSPLSVASMYGLADGLGYGAWTALGVTSGAVAVASLRQGLIAKWLGIVSAVVTAILALLAFFPFVSWFVAALWLLVAPFGLKDRAPRPAETLPSFSGATRVS